MYMNIETLHEKINVQIQLVRLHTAALGLVTKHLEKDLWDSVVTEGDFFGISFAIGEITITSLSRVKGFEPGVDRATIVRITNSDSENLFVAITKDDQTIVETYSPGLWEQLIFAHGSRSLH